MLQNRRRAPTLKPEGEFAHSSALPIAASKTLRKCFGSGMASFWFCAWFASARCTPAEVEGPARLRVVDAVLERLPVGDEVPGQRHRFPVVLAVNKRGHGPAPARHRVGTEEEQGALRLIDDPAITCGVSACLAASMSNGVNR
jgi:hypothetical protein